MWCVCAGGGRVADNAVGGSRAGGGGSGRLAVGGGLHSPERRRRPGTTRGRQAGLSGVRQSVLEQQQPEATPGQRTLVCRQLGVVSSVRQEVQDQAVPAGALARYTRHTPAQEL